MSVVDCDTPLSSPYHVLLSPESLDETQLQKKIRTRIPTKNPKPSQPQVFQVQLPDLDDETPPLLDLPLHRVNVGCNNRVIKAYWQLMSNSMMTGIADKEEVGI